MDGGRREAGAAGARPRCRCRRRVPRNLLACPCVRACVCQRVQRAKESLGLLRPPCLPPKKCLDRIGVRLPARDRRRNAAERSETLIHLDERITVSAAARCCVFLKYAVVVAAVVVFYIYT